MRRRDEAPRAREGELLPEAWEWVGEGPARALRYVKPITIGGPCLSCRGDAKAMKPEVAAIISERYPNVLAMVYRDGDLRGAVSVVVAAPGK